MIHWFWCRKLGRAESMSGLILSCMIVTQPLEIHNSIAWCQTIIYYYAFFNWGLVCCIWKSKRRSLCHLDVLVHTAEKFIYFLVILKSLTHSLKLWYLYVDKNSLNWEIYSWSLVLRARLPIRFSRASSLFLCNGHCRDSARRFFCTYVNTP